MMRTGKVGETLAPSDDSAELSVAKFPYTTTWKEDPWET